MKNKLDYKVFNKETQKYEGTSKKNQWTSLTWALAFVDSNRWFKKENVEIHILELVIKEKIDPIQLIKEKKEKERLKKEREQENMRQQLKVSHDLSCIVPGVNPGTTARMYKARQFNPEIMEKLKEPMKKWKELQYA